MKDIIEALNGKDYIEKLNDDYLVSFCGVDEVDELIDFIRDNWRADHIFVKSRKMFDFQHLDKINNRYNFVIARNKESKEIHSILGFIPSNHYDPDIKKVMIWPAIWKTREDIKVKGLGVALYYYLKENIKIDNISILGISEIALSIYKHWNFTTGKIKQYVLPNTNISEFVLSDGLNDVDINCSKEDIYCLEKLNEEAYLKLDESLKMFSDCGEYKSKNYYLNRFYRHPFYKYDFYMIKNDEAKAIIVARECEGNGAKCLRIVDYIGDIEYLSGVTNSLNRLMEDNSYEYIDFVEVGLDEDKLSNAGFIDRDSKSDIIVPNYFEPFDKRNIYLDYAFNSISDEKPVFYKADSDQDRPNYLKEGE